MTEPMTDERLAEIREMVWPYLRESWANELLAEVERLREQESRLTPVHWSTTFTGPLYESSEVDMQSISRQIVGYLITNPDLYKLQTIDNERMMSRAVTITSVILKRPETEAVNEAIRQAIRHYQGMVKP